MRREEGRKYVSREMKGRPFLMLVPADHSWICCLSAFTAVETVEFVSAHIHCDDTNRSTQLSVQTSSVFSVLPVQQTSAHEQEGAVS